MAEIFDEAYKQYPDLKVRDFEHFQELLQKSDVSPFVLFLYWDQCGWCHRFLPTFLETAVNTYPEAKDSIEFFPTFFETAVNTYPKTINLIGDGGRPRVQFFMMEKGLLTSEMFRTINPVGSIPQIFFIKKKPSFGNPFVNAEITRFPQAVIRKEYPVEEQMKRGELSPPREKLILTDWIISLSQDRYYSLLRFDYTNPNKNPLKRATIYYFIKTDTQGFPEITVLLSVLTEGVVITLHFYDANGQKKTIMKDTQTKKSRGGAIPKAVQEILQQDHLSRQRRGVSSSLIEKFDFNQNKIEDNLVYVFDEESNSPISTRTNWIPVPPEIRFRKNFAF